MRVGSAVSVTTCVHVVQKFLSNPACFALELNVSQGRKARPPSLNGRACSVAGSERSLTSNQRSSCRLARVSLESNCPHSPRENCLPRTEAGIDFVNGLDANVVVDCHDRTFVALSNDTVIVVFDNLIFQTCGNCREVGWAGSAPHFTYMYHTSYAAPAHLFFPSLPGPVVGETPSAARYAAVGVVGRPLPHVVRDALCEGDKGIAEVREQHTYPPSASAARECGGNCRGRLSSVAKDYADRDLDGPRNLPTLCAVRGNCTGECCILASL